MDKIDENFNWYLANQDDLVKKYNGTYIVIHEKEVADWFYSENEAFAYGMEKFGAGNFVAQLCTEGESAYTCQVFARNIFG